MPKPGTEMPPANVQAANTVSGQSTGPGAGATIASVAPVNGKGMYYVKVYTVYTGTLTAAETLGNMKLQTDQGGAAVDAAILTTPPQAGFMAPAQVYLVDWDGVGTIKVIAVGAAGGAAVYGAHIEVYPLFTFT